MTLLDRCNNIAQTLDRLAKLDRGRAVFGASSHKYRRAPVLAPDKVEQNEQELGVPFPEEFRAFVTTVHSGGAGPSYGFQFEPGFKPRRVVQSPFLFGTTDARKVIEARLSGTEKWSSLEMDDEEHEGDDEWPPGPGFITIAHHGCGVMDCLVVTGEQRGYVWCCDMAWCPHYKPTGEQVTFLDWYEMWLQEGLEKVAGGV